MSRLAGKRCLATGGRSGIGRAVVTLYLLPVLEVVAAFHRRVDFTLVYGRILGELE